MNTETLNKQDYQYGDEISVKELIAKVQDWCRYLLSKWLIIMLFGVLGAAAGLVYALFYKPIYTATTTFVLESGDTGGGLGQYAGIASMVGIDLGGSSGGLFQGDNITELYKSRSMMVQALLTKVQLDGKPILLIDRYLSSNHLRESWADHPNLKNLSFDSVAVSGAKKLSRVQDSVLTSIVSDLNEKYLQVSKLDKKLSIIKVDVKSTDEFFSKNFNDQIVMKVNDFYIQTKTRKSLENINILQQKTDSVRAVMNGAIYSAAAVVDATPNLNITRQVQRTAPVQRSQFAAETNKAILTELVKNLEISKMALSRERPLIQVVDQPVYPLTKSQVGKPKGIVIGGLFFGFLAVVCLILRRAFILLIKA